MTAVSSPPMVEAGKSCHNGSMICSLLDQWWFSQSILNHSVGFVAPSLDSETEYRSSGAYYASETAEGCSTSKFVDDDDHVLHQKNRGPIFNERKRCYAVDNAELRVVFDRIDEDQDGLITGENLRRFMKCCYGKDMSSDEVASMVASVDRNNDGAVDFEEFLSLYQNSPCHSADEATEQETGEDEEDKDDLLMTFQVFDKNHDGFISALELQTVLLNLRMPEGKSLISCEKMIQYVDHNGDGLCDLEEFQEMMSSHSTSRNHRNQ